MAAPHPWLKPAVLAGGLAPLGMLLLDWQQGTLGANPVERALNQLGLLALVFLVASLAVTPLKKLSGWTWPVRLRRMLGLFAFAYASLHLLTYVVLDQHFAWGTLLEDVAKRKFVTVGFAAWALMLPLALTSTNASVRRLGFPAWQRLHRLAYVAGALGVVHFVWRVKKDHTEPFLYGFVLLVLIALRVPGWRKEWRASRARAARAAAAPKVGNRSAQAE
ncbi:sulfite oxidase heme-binding subunit YedZ [Aggregicoccus sp. 17bor-14]|uniref:sulfite oxidase heme-binding subunit YedZ n=1 Tax=Myxococcaceae TaxID=31 RepID=UPI00351A6A64